MLGFSMLVSEASHGWGLTGVGAGGGRQVAFDGVGSLPMARIREVRSVKQAAVDVELARRGRNKAVHDAVRDSDRHAPYAAEGAMPLDFRFFQGFCFPPSLARVCAPLEMHANAQVVLLGCWTSGPRTG